MNKFTKTFFSDAFAGGLPRSLACIPICLFFLSLTACKPSSVEIVSPSEGYRSGFQPVGLEVNLHAEARTNSFSASIDGRGISTSFTDRNGLNFKAPTRGYCGNLPASGPVQTLEVSADWQGSKPFRSKNDTVRFHAPVLPLFEDQFAPFSIPAPTEPSEPPCQNVPEGSVCVHVTLPSSARFLDKNSEAGICVEFDGSAAFGSFPPPVTRPMPVEVSVQGSSPLVAVGPSPAALENPGDPTTITLTNGTPRACVTVQGQGAPGNVNLILTSPCYVATTWPLEIR